MAGNLGTQETNGIPLNILLVEDSDQDILITKRAFNNARFKNNLYIVNNGQECVDFIRCEGAYQDKEKFPRPDLILLDINMPKIDGIGVLGILKRDEEYKSIPIIMLTCSKNQEDITRSYANGANSFIQKPVEYEDFVKVVDSFNVYWHVLNKLPGREA